MTDSFLARVDSIEKCPTKSGASQASSMEVGRETAYASESSKEARSEQVRDETRSSLSEMLTAVLSKLGRPQSLDENLRYLQSEWLTTEQDLRACMQDDKAWRDLQLPSRLKLALKEECQRREVSVTSSIPAPIAAETLAASDAYLDVMQQELDNLPNDSTPPEIVAASEHIEHKANDTDEEEDDEGFLDQVNQKWVKSYSPEHKSPYFFNEITEETVWELPAGVEPCREDEWAALESSETPDAALLGEEAVVNKEEDNEESSEIEERRVAAQRARQLAREKAEEAQAIKAVAKAAAAERARSSGKGSIPPAPAPAEAGFGNGSLTGLHIEAPLPPPAPTVYIQPHTTTVHLPPSFAPPSAPILPAELLSLEAEAMPNVVSVEGTPLSSPGQPAAVAVPLGQADESESESEREVSGDQEEEEEDEEEEENSDAYADVEVELELLQLLTDMGFNEDVAALALQRHYNDLELATNACLRHQEREERKRGSPPSGSQSKARASPDSGRRVMNSSEYMRALEEAEGDMGPPPERPRSAGKPYKGRSMQRLSRFLGRMTTSAKKSKAQKNDRYEIKDV